MFADLHNHTTESDGKLSLESLIDLANKKGINAIGITDHDRIHSNINDKILKINGVEIINGIELRVKIGENNDNKVDLLGYGIDTSYELEKELDLIKKGRIDRAETMIRRLEDSFNIEMDIDISDNIGRPHIARSFSDKTNYTYQQVFDDIIGNDCEFYEERYITDSEKGLKLLNESCDLVCLAHPFRYNNPNSKIESLVDDLGGIEYYYPYNKNFNLDVIKEYALENNLVLSGGSDTHKKEDFGRCGLNESEYLEFKEIIQDLV